MNKHSKYYSLGTDVIFKYIFGNYKNVRYTENLLEHLEGLEKGTLKDKLEVQKSFDITKWRCDGHGYEMDVLVKRIDTGEYYNLEVYSNAFGDEEQLKSYSYAAAIYSNQLNSGDSYKDCKKYTQINFIKDKKYPSGNFFTLDANCPFRKFNEKSIRLDVINIIDKPEKSGYHIDEYIKRVFKLMEAKNSEEAIEIAKGMEELESMVRDIDRFNRDEWISEFFSVENDRKRRENGALKRGLEQGAKNNAIKTARNLLQLGSVSVEDISKATGLDIKELQKL